MTAKPYHGWAIRSPYGNWIMGFDTASRRSDAQKKIVDGHGGRMTWKRLYRKGFRAVRVVVSEVHP